MVECSHVQVKSSPLEKPTEYIASWLENFHKIITTLIFKSKIFMNDTLFMDKFCLKIG